MTASHVDLLRSRGYTSVQGVMTHVEVSALREAVDGLVVADDERFGAKRLRAAGQRGALRNLADRGVAFELALDLPVIHDAARAIVGDGYRLHSYDALVLGPGEGRFPWDFHTDLHALRGVAFPAARSPGLNCLLALDASGPDNGATWVVPASHRAVVTTPDTELLAQLAVQPPLAAGDVLMFDARLWHCAGHNRSAGTRRLIKIEFVQPWLATQMDYPRAVRPEIQARLGPRARAALGEPIPASAEDVLAAVERRQ